MLFLFEDKFFIKENDKTNKTSLYYVTLLLLYHLNQTVIFFFFLKLRGMLSFTNILLYL